MQAFLYINTLFKSTEYKIDSKNSLKLTELSVSGSHAQTISLSSLEAEQGYNTPPYLSWLALLLGCIVMALSVYFSKESTLLYNNLASIIMFLTCASGTLFFICKPVKHFIYRDSFSNRVLFKLSDNTSKDNAIKKFVHDLNRAIDDAKQSESNLINLQPNAKKAFETHNKNVTDLFNSGLIDEALYSRICNSMQEQVFGKSQNQYTTTNNVIYLNQ